MRLDHLLSKEESFDFVKCDERQHSVSQNDWQTKTKYTNFASISLFSFEGSFFLSEPTILAEMAYGWSGSFCNKTSNGFGLTEQTRLVTDILSKDKKTRAYSSGG